MNKRDELYKIAVPVLPFRILHALRNFQDHLWYLYFAEIKQKICICASMIHVYDLMIFFLNRRKHMFAHSVLEY